MTLTHRLPLTPQGAQRQGKAGQAGDQGDVGGGRPQLPDGGLIDVAEGQGFQEGQRLQQAVRGGQALVSGVQRQGKVQRNRSKQGHYNAKESLTVNSVEPSGYIEGIGVLFRSKRTRRQPDGAHSEGRSHHVHGPVTTIPGHLEGLPTPVRAVGTHTR